jgi:hypothetical protein
MSTVEMAAVLHHSKATGSTKLVLMGIAYHMGKDGLNGCWPAQGTLAEYANISVRQVQRSLNALVELGELEVIVHGAWAKGSAAQTNVYYLADLCPDMCDGSLNHKRKVATFMVASGDTGDQRWRHPRPQVAT